MTRTLRLMLVILMVFSLMVVTACGATEEPQPDEPETPETTEDPEDDPEDPVDDGEPRYGGVLVRAAIYGDAESLDPHHATRVAANMHLMNIFDGLVYLSEEGLEEPAVAESWDLSADGLVYTFYLREGVLFHNGREVTADDVKYSMERVMDPQNESPHMLRFESIVGAREFIAGEADEVVGLQAVDDYTVRFELVDVDNLFLRELTTLAGYILPKEEVERLGDRFSENPVGCGPFVFEGWVKDSEITMTAFEDYYRGRPYLDRVVARIIREPATREMEFESGGIDMYVLTDPQYARLQDDARYMDYLIEVPELFMRHIGFHTQKPPLDDVRVRQAINYAIDRNVIIEQVLHGKAYPAMGWFPPTNPGYNPDIVNHAYTYDPDKARELLADAGYEDGFTVTCLTTDHPAWGLPALEAAMGYLEDVGITVIPELQEGAVVLARAYEGDFEMYIHSFGIAHPLDLRRRSHTETFGAPGNTFRYSNEVVDSLLDRAMRAVDRDEMLELLREAELIILEEAPTWFYNYNKAVMIHQPWVHGLVANPADMDYQFLQDVWLTRDE